MHNPVQILRRADRLVGLVILRECDFDFLDELVFGHACIGAGPRDFGAGLDAFQVALVESPGGFSPPGAPRSVREPLDSYGSRCSAVSMAELPVSEEGWIYSA